MTEQICCPIERIFWHEVMQSPSAAPLFLKQSHSIWQVSTAGSNAGFFSRLEHPLSPNVPMAPKATTRTSVFQLGREFMIPPFVRVSQRIQLLWGPPLCQ